MDTPILLAKNDFWDLRVFHLTYWYPNAQDPSEAPWIRSHIAALAPYVDSQFVFHAGIGPGERFSLKKSQKTPSHTSLLLRGPMPWWMIEIMTGIIVAYVLLFKTRGYSIVNVHIAYPLLTYFHFVKHWVKKPVVITEHWSAYHFNLGVTKQLPRVIRIFKNRLPLVTVSKSLFEDIRRFSGQTGLKCCIVPNAIDEQIFFLRETGVKRRAFLMLSHWKTPKDPSLVIRAFGEFIQSDPRRMDFQLRIGGRGNLVPRMEALVTTLGLERNVVFLGPLSPEEVAAEMNSCMAFLHASKYETFSVVCAEALCCGVPVVASAVGGITEYVHPKNGILVNGDAVGDWSAALMHLADSIFDRKRISREARDKFAFKEVGKRYFQFLKEVESKK